MPAVFFDYLTTIYVRNGYLLVFLGNLIDTSPLGWLVPGGILVAMGGFFANGTSLTFTGVYIAAVLGMMASLYITYYLGYKTGMVLAKKAKQEKNAEKMLRLLNKDNSFLFITTLLANFTRFWMAYVAGSKKFNLEKFTIYGLITSVIWNGLLVGVGYGAGNEREKLQESITNIGIVAWLFLIIAIAVIYWKIDSEFRRTNDLDNK